MSETMTTIATNDGTFSAHMARPAAAKAPRATLVEALSGYPLVAVHGYAGRDHAFTRKGEEHFDAVDAALPEQSTLAFFAANP